MSILEDTDKSYRELYGHERCNILWGDEPWKGRVLFTGPDGVRDQHVNVEEEHRYVGIGTMSPEGTSESDYLWRPAPNTPFQKPKSSKVGEVGWDIPEKQDWSSPNTYRQIMMGVFRQELEDRHSHLHQNPWYPAPGETGVGKQNGVRSASRGHGTAGKKHSNGVTDSSSDASSVPGERTKRHMRNH